MHHNTRIAVQKGVKGSAGNDYTYDQLYNHTSNLFEVFNETTNTELTFQQLAYLSEQQDSMKIKGEIILYNLQDYLNYIVHESKRYNNMNPIDSLKRSNEDMFTADIIQMKNYLTTGKVNGMPLKIPVEAITYDYGTLVKDITYDDKNTSKYDKSKVIVQIKDNDGYIRYMKLIDMNNDTIQLKSGSVSINNDQSVFINMHVWQDYDNCVNPNHSFNVIIVPKDYSTDYVLRLIWSKQDSDLTTKETYCNSGYTILTSALGSAGLSVFFTGAYRLSEGDRNNLRQQLHENIDNVVPHVPQEGAPLVPEDWIGASYQSISSNDGQPQKRTVTASKCIAASGFLIAIGSAVGLFFTANCCSQYKKEHENLRKYEPPLAK
jgi:hypothetical protein